MHLVDHSFGREEGIDKIAIVKQRREAPVIISDKKDFRYDADDLMDFYADKNIDLLLLVNPDNPSGIHYAEESCF